MTAHWHLGRPCPCPPVAALIAETSGRNVKWCSVWELRQATGPRTTGMSTAEARTALAAFVGGVAAIGLAWKGWRR